MKNRRLYSMISAVYAVYRSCKLHNDKSRWDRFYDRVTRDARFQMTEAEGKRWLKKTFGGAK